MLRERDVPTLRGNHEQYILSGEGCPRSRSANVCLAAQRATLTAQSLEWLASTRPGPVMLGEASLVHGGWRDPIDEYIERVEPDYFAGLDGSVFFAGHTHVQGLCPLGEGRRFVNPGSVGQPRDGDWRAAFALYQPSTADVRLCRVEYDVEEVGRAMTAAGLDEPLWTCLRAGTRIGGAVSSIVR